MTSNPLWRACGITLAGLLVLCLGAGAQQTIAPAPLPIPAGLDIWSTPDTGARVENLFIPNDFFCPGSLARTVDIPLKGKPIVTAPAGALGTTDTVVHRLGDATVLPGGSVDVPIQAVALSLVGSAPFDVAECGQRYAVRVCLANSGDVGTIRIHLDSAGNCGTFDAYLPLTGAVTFTGGGRTLGPLVDSVQVTTAGAHWARTVGANGVDFGGPVQLDQDCDGAADGQTFPGTSGFHPGWSCNPPPSHTCPSPPCIVPTKHTGPHPDTLPPVKVLVKEPIDEEPIGVEGAS